MPAARTPIRALVVDYGEVLSEAPDPAAFDAMARLVGVAPTLFTDVYWELRPPYDRGELDGPAYWSHLGTRVGVGIDAALTAQLVGRDIALWSRIDERMLTWVNDIAGQGVRVGLLSNMVAEIGEHLRGTLCLFEGFTSVTYSYEVGLAKPDPRIYHLALAGLDANPNEALFVDDRAPNIAAARAIGLHAHHFRGHDGLVSEIDATYALVTVS